MLSRRRSIYFILLLILFFVFPAEKTYAKTGNDFSIDFGLLVHQINENRPVPRIKALEVFFKYFDPDDFYYASAPAMFSDLKESPRISSVVNKACGLDITECEGGKFKPYDPISQYDFLNWFFKFKYLKDPDFLAKKYPYLHSDFARAWVEARSLNLFGAGPVTFKVFQDLLYRNNISEANLGMPYMEGLAIDLNDINEENYHSYREIDLLIGNLKTINDDLLKKNVLSQEEAVYQKRIEANLTAFKALKARLAAIPYIFRERTDLDPAVMGAIRTYKMQDILASYTYDFSKNAAYRKRNLVTGAKRIHGKIFQPDEIINMWKIIAEKGFADFEYGWVISEGTEQWQFGGGICGSSTMIFIPSWLAGLEVVERKNHSVFYTNLYPAEYIGLDATVFRPRPNLIMKNNTGSPIAFNVSVDKEKELLTVEIFGNKPYKELVIEGPIKETRTHIKWIRNFIWFDGTIRSESLESRYNAIHGSL